MDFRFNYKWKANNNHFDEAQSQWLFFIVHWGPRFFLTELIYVESTFLAKTIKKANINIAQRKKKYKRHYYIIFVLCS